MFNGQGWRVTSQSLTLLLLRRWMGQWRDQSFSLREGWGEEGDGDGGSGGL